MAEASTQTRVSDPGYTSQCHARWLALLAPVTPGLRLMPAPRGGDDGLDGLELGRPSEFAARLGLMGAPNAAEAKPFVEFLQGEKAGDIFRKRGFAVIPPATAKP